MTPEDAVKKRQSDEQNALIEKLEQLPIIQVACQKLGIGRTTYYRCRRESKTFAERADKALSAGKLLVNDMAESQLISAIKDKNMTAIIFWLKSHHYEYADKLKISGTIKNDDEKLTKEQKAIVRKALEMADFKIKK